MKIYKLYKNMIKDNKDLIFWTVAGTWLVINILLWILLGADYCFYSNTGFTIGLGIFIIIERKNKKLRNWLNKKDSYEKI